MMTGTERVVPPAVTLIVPLKVPGPRPVGSAVTVRTAGALGVACPEVWDRVSHRAPAGVATMLAAVNRSVPPPALETVRVWLCAGVDLAKAKDKFRGSSGASVGAWAAERVKITVTMLAAGTALGVKMAMVAV
jgi:hypothetical protein